MAMHHVTSHPMACVKSPTRRQFVVGTGGALASLVAGSVNAADYPEHPIKVIVPTTAGSVPDMVARLVGQRLAGALDQSVVVDNRPGGGGIIGLQAVARAAADGYTLGLQTLSYVITPSLVASMPYDIERDLRTVTLLNWNYAVLSLRESSPIRTLPEFVEQAKARPGELKYSSPGNATPAHLVMALLAHQTGTSLLHVPYKGGPAAQSALLAGDVDAFAGSVGFAANYAKAGKIRLLAVSSPQRVQALPEVPTFTELGLPGIVLTDWQGIVAPAATPQKVVDRLHAALLVALAAPDVKEHLAKIGLEPAGLGPSEFAEHQHADMRKWHALVRQAGIRAE